MRRIELPGSHRVRHGGAAAPARHDAGAGERARIHRGALGRALRAACARPAGGRAHDNADALAALMTENATVERRATAAGSGRDATLGAAGATVAVLGTAAVVRQIRRQRRGG